MQLCNSKVFKKRIITELCSMWCKIWELCRHYTTGYFRYRVALWSKLCRHNLSHPINNMSSSYVVENLTQEIMTDAKIPELKTFHPSLIINVLYVLTNKIRLQSVAIGKPRKLSKHLNYSWKLNLYKMIEYQLTELLPRQNGLTSTSLLSSYCFVLVKFCFLFICRRSSNHANINYCGATHGTQ